MVKRIKMESRRVVVTGTGVISAIGNNTTDFWKNIVDCKPGIGEYHHPLAEHIRFKNGADVKNFDGTQYLEKGDLDLMDRFAQFAVVAAKEAVHQSSFIVDKENKYRTAVICGTSIGGIHAQEQSYFEVYKENKTRVHPLTIPKSMPNGGASNISMQMGITGPVYTISTACASSNHAIGNAFWLIRSGICDQAIAGGSETPFTYTFLKAWEAIRVVAQDTCRPFSKSRQGMILGEGAGMLMMETLEAAQKRGATILAEVIGFGMTSDASHITKPDQKGAEEAMRMAIRDAGIHPAQIGYINAHGTGTLVNDSMEVAAVKNVFGEHANQLAISSTKSLHGHALGATSSLEAIATIMALKEGLLPPTANFQEKDEACDLDVVPNASRKKEIHYALSNAFAFGGLNAVLAFKKWED
jgi:nodulation protein E